MRDPRTLVVAAIQNGNVASLASARKWATQVTGRMVASTMPMRRRPPPLGNLKFREASPVELGQVAEAINSFYTERDLTRPQSASSLASWFERSRLPTPVCLYMVAVDPKGQIVAGFGI